MNKILLTIIVVGCLISTTLGAVSAYSYSHDSFSRHEFDLNPAPTENGDLLNPIYLKKWSSDEFDYSDGYKSIVLNSYIYVLVYLYDVVDYIVTNQHTGLLKLKMSNGNFEDIIVFEGLRSPSDVITYQNHIYVIMYNKIYTGLPEIVKLDEDLNIIDNQFLNIVGRYREPRCVKTDGDYIYVAGSTRISGDPQENIFLGKLDSDCNLVWDDFVYYDIGIDYIGYNAITIDDDGFIYLTGSSRINDDLGAIFILKYDSNGNLIKEKKEYNSYMTFDTIKFYDNKLFVSKTVYQGTGFNLDMRLSTYDKELNLLWDSEIIDESIFLECMDDMVFVDNFVYLCGVLLDADLEHGILLSMNGYILKFNLTSNEKEWCRKVPSYSDSWSIHKDEEKNLYLSGIIFEDEDSSNTYVLKFDTQNDPPATPEIKGAPKGSPGKENTYTISTTDPEGNQVYYFVSWGDKTYENWIGPYESGEEVVIRHTYENKGFYTIGVIAKDIHDALSFEGKMKVNIPRSRTKSTPILDFLQENSLLLQLLQRIFIR